MYIKYAPAAADAVTRPATTNLGIFTPGQIGGPYLSDTHQRWAQRLVTNDEFVECDRDGRSLVAPAISVDEAPRTVAKESAAAKPKR